MARYGSALDEKMQQAEERNKNKKVQVKGPSGQLTSVTPSSLSQATELQTGGPSPVTPLGASQMGVGPDSAKMAGTQVQKDSALKQAVDPSQQLSTVQRQQQGRQQTREEEQAKLEKSEQLQKLGGLGDQVYNLISGQFSDLQAKGEVKLEGAPEEIASALQSGDQAQITGAIQDWANKEISEGRPVNFETMKQMFPNPQDAIAAAVAAGIENELVVDDSLIQGLGFESMADLEAQTGIQVPEGATLQDVQSIVEGEITAEFDRTENLRQLMNDPNTSPQERAAARQELIDMGAIGLSAGEQAAHQIEQAVSEADEITFGGEKVSLENLMNDEFVSGLAKRFFEDPEYAAKIKEENPEFASFLETNQAALQDLTAELDESVTQVTEAYDEQQALANIEGVGELDKEAIKNVFGVDIDKYGADTQNLTNDPLYRTMTDDKIDPESRAQLVSSVSSLGLSDPDMAKQLLNMDQEALERLGAFEPDGMLAQYAKWSQHPKSATPEQAFAFSQIQNIADLVNAPKLLERANFANTLGITEAAWDEPGVAKLAERIVDQYGSFFDDGELSQVEMGKMDPEALSAVYTYGKGAVREDVAEEIYNQSTAAMESIEPLPEFEMPTLSAADLKPISDSLTGGQEVWSTARGEALRALGDQKDLAQRNLDQLMEIKRKYPGGRNMEIDKQIRELSKTVKGLDKAIRQPHTLVDKIADAKKKKEASIAKSPTATLIPGVSY